MTVELVQTKRGTFRHVGASRVVPDGPSHTGAVLVCGAQVTCRRQTPTRGTWKRYDGRSGIVVTISHERFADSNLEPKPLDYIEVGVMVGSRNLWFRLDEIDIVAPNGGEVA